MSGHCCLKYGHDTTIMAETPYPGLSQDTVSDRHSISCNLGPNIPSLCSNINRGLAAMVCHRLHCLGRVNSGIYGIRL